MGVCFVFEGGGCDFLARGGIPDHVLGNGAHAWIFFDTPVTAFKARKLKNVYFCKKIRGKNIAAVYFGK